jgi:hypothetical protein
MGPNVTFQQGPKVSRPLVTFGPMEDTSRLAAFAARMNELCDDKGLPARGRQVALAAQFKVTNKAARKWLLGLGYPEMDMAIQIAAWGDVSVNWLLQGLGPKHERRIDARAALLDEAVRMLPREAGIDLIDSLRAKLIRIGRLDVNEPAPRYGKMLDAYEDELGRKPH